MCMLRYTYLSASNLFMCVLIFLFVYLYLSISLYVHSSLPIAVCIEKGNPLMRCSYCAGHTVGELYIYFNSSHYRFFPFLFFLCVIHVSFMGASIVCVTNLDWTVDSVLWFPEKTSDWKTLGTKKPKNILCSQYFTSIKISTQMVCFLCCQIMCTSISRPTLERERRGGGTNLAAIFIKTHCKCKTRCMDVRFGAKVGQIGPKFGQIGDFSDHIPVNFDTAIQNVLKSDLKKSRIFPIWGQSDTLWSQVRHRWHVVLSQPLSSHTLRKIAVSYVQM